MYVPVHCTNMPRIIARGRYVASLDRSLQKQIGVANWAKISNHMEDRAKSNRFVIEKLITLRLLL